MIKCPAYLQEFSDLQELLSQHLKGWAFHISLGGSVRVYHRKNIVYVREILAKNNMEHVKVSLC